MDTTKYVGMDVHTEAISVAVRNSAGKVVMESILETKANTILEFIEGLRGNVQVTFEEGTWAAWLYDLLKPHVTTVVELQRSRDTDTRQCTIPLRWRRATTFQETAATSRTQ